MKPVNTADLKLNDFASFDRALFDEAELALSEQERWKDRFYDALTRTLMLPIPSAPEIIEEFQLCHYIQWMSIWAHSVEKIERKPRRYYLEDHTPTPVPFGCYACLYADEVYGSDEHICPIRVWRKCRCCRIRGDKPGRAYVRWINSLDQEEARAYAYEIAHYEWVDDKECPDYYDDYDRHLKTSIFDKHIWWFRE